MKVRKVQKKDKSRMNEVLDGIYKKGLFKKEEVECALELLEAHLNNSTDYEHVCCVNEDDVFLGYSCYGKVPLTDAVYDLYWIAVDVNEHNKGIGKKIMEYIEKDLKSRKARKLLIETSSQKIYEPTRMFYIKLNYKEVSRIKDFYSSGDDRVTYEKLL